MSEQTTQPTGAQQSLPLIVLDGAVVFPYTVVTLPTEGESALAVEAAMQDGRLVLLVARRADADAEAPLPLQLHRVGVVARIEQSGTLPNGATGIAADEPKKIVMHFIYKEVTKEQVAETFGEAMAKSSTVAAQKSNFEKVESWLPSALHSGDEMTFEYVPGTGTTFKINSSTKGTIAGTDFMKAVWTIYLGSNPPTADLKKGMLGG